jgi:hypothetical protein
MCEKSMDMLIYGKYYVGNIPVFCGVFQIGVEKYIYLIIYCKRGKNFQ